MYQPAAFREDRRDVQHALIRQYPLGLLITAGAGGLMANPIPFLLDDATSEHGTLRGHLARANPQARELADVADCLVVFQGPQQYVTPSWYATKRDTGKVVPTWNYATVHAWGRPTVLDDTTWLRQQIAQLTHQHEHTREVPWAVADAPESFLAGQLKGIIGIEILLTRIEGKWKVSQNRPQQDRQGVLAALREQGQTAEEMAALVAAYGGLDHDTA